MSEICLRYTGRLKKTALIENRLNTQIQRLDCAESAVFLMINDHCDMGNTYLCLCLCFLGVLRISHKYFEGASRSFNECLQKDLFVSSLCFNGVLGCFYQKRFTFVYRSHGSYPCKLNWTEKP